MLVAVQSAHAIYMARAFGRACAGSVIPKCDHFSNH
ncbi:hypothetical protein CfE428DRAFT_3587 [Chthoniobacter flavus Ellin428]|uniref:Uncharacterized protein n=1 Tax=Chthoniobacter flavus Ellin428 TaxID=497964 RepID=B4D3U9_9BACT|nr:hypothetical protein CfE428DRAFT_3587 [Chthoniobacter flavus Ellin428]